MPQAPRIASDLPAPSPEEQALSERLTQSIRDEIGTDSVAFARFMELALYAPMLGYYTAGREKFGARGDYVTAPELSPLFGRCLAATAAEVLNQLGHGDILEVGPGSGKLAAELLAELARRDALPETYYLLDLSVELRARQQQTLQALPAELRARVRWLDMLPDPGFHGLIVANELLDAMPVERFTIVGSGARAAHVGWRDDRCVWVDGPARADIEARVGALGLAPGYTSEIGLAAEAWVRSAGDCLGAGALLLIDYGFPRAEFYHPERAGGTLMCHYRHHAHTDPLIRVGLQDITAHVDFSAIAEAGDESGLDLLGYTSQGAFLLASGLPELVQTSNPDDVRAHLALMEQVKKLTLPHEMGELFKVMALGRGMDTPLRGFGLQDRRARL